MNAKLLSQLYNFQEKDDVVELIHVLARSWYKSNLY